MIRIGCVNYTNSIPFLYGIKNKPFAKEMKATLQTFSPAECAKALLDNTIDIGLVPVAILPLLPYYKIISDYGIAADGKVQSVLLCSECPIQEVETLLLDFESRTSIQLATILCKNYWHIQPVLEPAKQHYQQKIKGTTAGVIIGDKAFNLGYTYQYDLAEMWKNHTNLPFVFAVWATTLPSLDTEIIRVFNQALQYGVESIPALSKLYPDNETYWTQYIHYYLDERKKQGLELFLSWIGK